LNPTIDHYVLEALKRWKWKPALKNGIAVESVPGFNFPIGSSLKCIE
jgi:hypothetical protein